MSVAYYDIPLFGAYVIGAIFVVMVFVIWHSTRP